MKTKHLLSLLLTLCASSLWAYDVEVNGIYYDLSPKVKLASVTKGDNMYAGDITIPSKIEVDGTSYSVTSIGAEAFAQSVVKNITISEGISSIEFGAFHNCYDLKSIHIPSSITNIGSSAFWNTYRLTEAYFTSIESLCRIEFNGVESHPFTYNERTKSNHLFINGEEIVEINIPDYITSISSNAFCGCNLLISVTIPSGVVNIGNAAFSRCSSLTSVTIPNSVVTIGNAAFSGCSKLTSLSIPNNVVTIGESAFSGCENLAMVSFGNGITTIGEYAFNFCTNLTKVQFASIESLCNIDFKYGSNPLSVSSKPSYLFINEEEIKELKIPNGITSIRDYTFCGCSSLTSVDIPNTVTSIGDYAFSGCSNLTTVIMPNSVNYIGGLAFADCRYLTDVYCYFEKMPETNYGIFENSDIEFTRPEYPVLSRNKAA